VLLLTRLVLPEDLEVLPEVRLPPEEELLRTVPEVLRLPPEVLLLAAVVPVLRLPPPETVRLLLLEPPAVVALVPLERRPPSLRTLLVPEEEPLMGFGLLRPP